MPVTLRMVEAFRAVMLAGGVTRGAALLHVSQPSVSRLIRDLEHALRLKLFERRGARVHPTEDALALAAEVEQSFAGLERIAFAASRIRDRRLGRLRIACMPVFGLCDLPAAVARLARAEPPVFVQLQLVASSSAHQLLAARQVDVAFAMPAGDGGAAAARVYGGDCVCILPAGHALAARRTIGPALLRDEPFVSLAPNTLTKARVDACFREAGVERRRIVIETTQSLSASDLVLRGAGVAVVDPFAARRHAAAGGACRPFRPRIAFEVGCYLPPGETPSAPVARLLELLPPAASGRG